jgi:hypothetical protein
VVDARGNVVESATAEINVPRLDRLGNLNEVVHFTGVMTCLTILNGQFEHNMNEI